MTGFDTEVKVAEPDNEVIWSGADTEVRVSSYDQPINAFKSDIIVEFAVADPDDITAADIFFQPGNGKKIAESYETTRSESELSVMRAYVSDETTLRDNDGYLVTFRTSESDETQRGDQEGAVGVDSDTRGDIEGRLLLWDIVRTPESEDSESGII